MAEFFAVYEPAERGRQHTNIAITGKTQKEVMEKAVSFEGEMSPDYLFAIRARYIEAEGPFVWAIGEGWNDRAFEAHLNPPAGKE